MNENHESFDCWAVVELFGHQQIAGKVTEQAISEQGFIRVDVPEDEQHPGFTRLLGHGAIYSIIPTTEEIARAFSRRNYQRPIHEFQLLLPEVSGGGTGRPQDAGFVHLDDNSGEWQSTPIGQFVGSSDDTFVSGREIEEDEEAPF